MPDPMRGEVWLSDLDPIRGHEQAGRRPVLVISVDRFNSGPSGLVIVIPITSRPKKATSHVEIIPPEGGVRRDSYIKCEDVRSISKERLIERWGAVTEATLTATALRLRLLMNL